MIFLTVDASIDVIDALGMILSHYELVIVMYFFFFSLISNVRSCLKCFLLFHHLYSLGYGTPNGFSGCYFPAYLS